VTRRQRLPQQWFVLTGPHAAEQWQALLQLPRGSGVLLLADLGGSEAPRLRRLANTRNLTVIMERRGPAARVHDLHELTRALLGRKTLIFLSPICPTRSHPSWKRLPRMRAATLARLGGRRVFALGGMNVRRYARIAPLGFIGWAGISAWSRVKVTNVTRSVGKNETLGERDPPRT
jgi:thiamine-phosphate pyrophosphorylase